MVLISIEQHNPHRWYHCTAHSVAFGLIVTMLSIRPSKSQSGRNAKIALSKQRPASQLFSHIVNSLRQPPEEYRPTSSDAKSHVQLAEPIDRCIAHRESRSFISSLPGLVVRAPSHIVSLSRSSAVGQSGEFPETQSLVAPFK